MTRNRFYLPQLIVTSLFLLSGCYFDDHHGNGPCLRGEGSTIQETREVGNFSGIAAGFSGDIFIRQDSTPNLVIEARENIIGEIKTEVNNNILEVSIDRCVKSSGNIALYATMPDIRSLSLAGSGNVRNDNDLKLGDLEVNISGSGNVALSGEVDNLDVTVTGSGNMRLFDLISNTSVVRITGSGNVEVYSMDQLIVTITGSGTVFYKGSPEINTSITGSGNVINRN